LTFKGRGYGHGVGMCQEGAMQMAKVGYTFPEILKYYFKGIDLIKKK
jgi:stage II sporulation protein D